MSLPITILFYALLLIHVVSFLGVLAIALKSLTKGGPARGMWHASVSALVAGLGLAAMLSIYGDPNTTKLGIKLAIAIAVVALSLLTARREREAAEASLLAAAARGGAPAPADPRDLSDDDERAPIDPIRPLLIAVVIGVLANTLIALLW